VIVARTVSSNTRIHVFLVTNSADPVGKSVGGTKTRPLSESTCTMSSTFSSNTRSQMAFDTSDEVLPSVSSNAETSSRDTVRWEL